MITLLASLGLLVPVVGVLVGSSISESDEVTVIALEFRLLAFVWMGEEGSLNATIFGDGGTISWGGVGEAFVDEVGEPTMAAWYAEGAGGGGLAIGTAPAELVDCKASLASFSLVTHISTFSWLSACK
jgi:hypothetical protein